MKLSNVVTHLVAMTLTAATAAAGASLPKSQYNLRIVGGTQQLDQALLAPSSTSGRTTELIVAPNTNNPAVLLSPLPSASSPGPILASAAAPMTYLILQGPSGKGEYSLRISTETTPIGIGSMIFWDAFMVVDVGTKKYLRFKDDTNKYHWVAETGTGRVWWTAPSPANVGDIEGVEVDVEVVEV